MARIYDTLAQDWYYTAHVLSESEEGKDYFLVSAAAVLRQWVEVPEGLEWFKIRAGRARGSDVEICQDVKTKIYNALIDRFVTPEDIAADPSGQVLLDAIDELREWYARGKCSPTSAAP